jgi:DNA-binding beta-propeller fold protein YncE
MMKNSLARRVMPALGALLLAVHSFPSAAAPPARQGSLLQLVRDYPLPGGATRWDYMSIDPSHGKLVLAHLGDGAVVVVDTHSKSVLGQVRPVAQVHGVLAVSELDRIYATATGTDELVAIDGTSLRIVARIPVGRYPDGLAYAPSAGKVYVSDKDGRTESVVDAHTGRRVATLALGSAVGNSQYDPASGHVFINAQDTGELVEVDPATDRIVARARLPGAEGNHGLLIEPKLRLAFIACEGNDKLLVLDLRERRVTAQFKVAGEPDVLAYDPGLGVLYVATESGPVHLFRVSADGVARLGAVWVGPNAHTVAVDPVSHEVYFPLMQAGAGPVLRVMRPGA